jgi:hypothetical protein
MAVTSPPFPHARGGEVDVLTQVALQGDAGEPTRRVDLDEVINPLSREQFGTRAVGADRKTGEGLEILLPEDQDAERCRFPGDDLPLVIDHVFTRGVDPREAEDATRVHLVARLEVELLVADLGHEAEVGAQTAAQIFEAGGEVVPRGASTPAKQKAAIVQLLTVPLRGEGGIDGGFGSGDQGLAEDAVFLARSPLGNPHSARD